MVEKYLSNPQDMYQAINLLLDSELFTYHYERMVGIMMTDAQEVGQLLSSPESS